MIAASKSWGRGGKQMWEARLTRRAFLAALARGALGVGAALLVVPFGGGAAFAKPPEEPLVGDPGYGDRVAGLFSGAAVRSL